MNSLVTAMRVFVDKFQILSKIDLTCTNLRTNATSTLYGRTDGGPVSDQSFRCNSDEVSVGFYGRYGQMIDQIGLLCEKLVVVQPALAATKPPPAPAPSTGSGVDDPKTAKIVQDVNLYASPPLRFRQQTGHPLPNPPRKGMTVKLFECRADGWCRVDGGWILIK